MLLFVLQLIQMVTIECIQNTNTTINTNTRIIANLDARKAIIKEQSKLTKQVKKAGKQSPGGLDCFKEENMYHSEKNISRYLEDSSIMHAYDASKLDQEWN